MRNDSVQFRALLPNRTSVLFALFLCAVTYPLATSAQVPSGSRLDSPKEFYNQGYVHAERRATPSPSETARSVTSPSAGEEPMPELSEPLPHDTPPPESEAPSVSEEAVSEETGMKPKQMRLLVAGHDPVHLKQQLSRFLEFAAKHKIPVQDVFVVGDPLKVYQESALHEYESHPSQPLIRVVRTVPAPFSAARNSPVLILQLGDSSTMVEGYGDLSRLFSAEGEFLEPRAESPRV